MQLRALVLTLGVAAAGCGTTKPGKIMADTPAPTPEDPNAFLVPYEAPDIEELSGVEDADTDGDSEAPAPAPAAATPAQPK